MHLVDVHATVVVVEVVVVVVVVDVVAVMTGPQSGLLEVQSQFCPEKLKLVSPVQG